MITYNDYGMGIMEKVLSDDNAFQSKHRSSAPYKEGDKVYIVKEIISGRGIPVDLINKQMIVESVNAVPVTDGVSWTVDLKGCRFIITSDILSKEKRF